MIRKLFFLVCLAYLRYCKCFVLNYRDKISSSLCNSKTDYSNAKLPIIQVIDDMELVGELVYDGNSDIDSFTSKFQIILKSLYQNKKNSEINDAIRSQSIPNIYSDEMLSEAMKYNRNTMLAILIYNDYCKNCIEFQSKFEEISKLNNEKYHFIFAKVTDIPDYYDALKKRLLGINITNHIFNKDVLLQDCKVCESTGKIECNECHGKGHVIKGNYAIFCPTCCGKKFIRCDKCGGKCLNCE